MLRSFVSFLDRLGFGHVFPFLRSAVEMRAFLVVNMRFGVNPNQAVASARRERFARRACGRTSHGRRTARRGTACS